MFQQVEQFNMWEILQAQRRRGTALLIIHTVPDTGPENSGSKGIVQDKNAYRPTSRGGTESKREGKQQLPVWIKCCSPHQSGA